MTLLAVNTGSSSVKFQLFADTLDLPLVAIGDVSGIGSVPVFSVTYADAHDTHPLPATTTQETALHLILHWMQSEGRHFTLHGVVHRIVHGGEFFTAPVVLTAEVMAQLQTLIPFAPLHQPHNLAGVEIIGRIAPSIPQIACFDTAFHAGHTALFTQYAIPHTWRDAGIRRYGFHGLSYEWIAHTLQENEPALANGRLVAAHLGSGASVCAMHAGKSIDTTMGLTALDGLPMGTRCGAIDPGALIYALRHFSMDVDALEHALYHDCGLLGLSGITANMQLLEQNPSPEAAFALDYFCLKAAQHIAKMAVSLGGMDALVFTGGIGEHSQRIRDAILSRLMFFPAFKTLVIPANEERMMAMHARALLEQQ